MTPSITTPRRTLQAIPGTWGKSKKLALSMTSSRRAIKGVLSVLGLAACFVALAQPQYGWGTRRIPATNLDVIIVLDYSKSMFARDVVPSRTVRAKAEVARLVAELPGARFGAVAFAGQPMSFPVTSDGGAIAQFFRQLSPNDMPIGGTAIARALEAGRELLKRDPLSAKHRKVILLAEDLINAGTPPPVSGDKLVIRGREVNIQAVDDNTRRDGVELIAYVIQCRG